MFLPCTMFPYAPIVTGHYLVEGMHDQLQRVFFGRACNGPILVAGTHTRYILSHPSSISSLYKFSLWQFLYRFCQCQYLDLYGHFIISIKTIVNCTLMLVHLLNTVIGHAPSLHGVIEDRNYSGHFTYP